jgi:hypothetical protein
MVRISAVRSVDACVFPSALVRAASGIRRSVV